jgi:hypothetical protein
MSMYYSHEIVKLVMDERLEGARTHNLLHCCEEPAEVQPKNSIFEAISRLFARPNQAACDC